MDQKSQQQHRDEAHIISVTSTKGGVGKTTLAANLGALLADLGLNVLLVDADVQPSLSRYFDLAERAPQGLTALVKSGGRPDTNCISKTVRPNLDIIVSDSRGDELQIWLKERPDALFIMKRALHNDAVMRRYDAVVIDTQGAVGPLQMTAAMAAKTMLSPVNPTVISSTEFTNGTLAMLDTLNCMADMSDKAKAGELRAVVYAQDRSTSARKIADAIRETFRATNRVCVTKSVIPYSAAFTTAAALRIPAYEYERPNSKKQRNTAYQVLHELVWELFPNFLDIYYDDASAPKTSQEQGNRE